MRANVKFGCLQEREMVRLGHPSSNAYRVFDDYLYHRMEFDIPESGSERVEVTCPVCSHPVTIRLDNPSKAILLLQLAFLLCGFVCFGLAAGLFVGPGKGSAVVQWISFAIAGLGVALLAAAVFAQKLPVSLIKENLVSIANDSIRDPIHAESNPRPRRHQLLDIQFA